LPVDEKRELMKLVVASLDLALSKDAVLPAGAPERVRRLLEQDIALHENVIEYWAAVGHPKRSWRVTPMMRQIRARRRAT